MFWELLCGSAESAEQWLDLLILKVFSNLVDPMILSLYSSYYNGLLSTCGYYTSVILPIHVAEFQWFSEDTD